MTTPVGVGLVGYGVGGAFFHAPVIGAVNGLRLSAVVTSRRRQVEQDWPGVAVASGVKELLTDPGVELVVVSTPTITHFDIARAALEAGKHVVVDKPFTTTVKQADELIATATRMGVRLSVYQNRRWDGDFLTVRRCIEDGSVGEVYHYEAHFDRFRPQIKGGWRDTPQPGSGILYDLGAHLIDQAICLFGVPQAVFGDAFAQRPEAQSVDYFHLILEYGRMRAILHAGTLVREPGPHFAVHGDGGSYVKYGLDVQEEALRAGARPGSGDWGIEPLEHYGELVLDRGTRTRVPTARGCYECYYQAMAEAIRHGGRVPVDPVDSRNGIAVIEAALQSAKDRCLVAL